jgi:hypothetical protein
MVMVFEDAATRGATKAQVETAGLIRLQQMRSNGQAFNPGMKTVDGSWLRAGEQQFYG